MAGLVIAAAAACNAGPTFSITFPPTLRAEPATGRVVVYLVREGSRVGRGAAPADGPFWDDPQPMYGVDAVGAAPGEPIIIDNAATAFPVPLSQLPPGAYRAQAVLDMHRLNSSWRREPGNLLSEPVRFTFAAGESPVVKIELNDAVGDRSRPEMEGADVFEVRSELLSAFHGREVTLRAGVAFPSRHDRSRKYAAVYEVPGFGGDYEGAFALARERSDAPIRGPVADFVSSTFWIVLDPESENGHHLFADSANNGPRGEALVKELIPALEAKYNLVADPSARLLRGHSSGGWSTLWLALTYPGTFGATWSTSPDPVDFRRFQLPNIYSHTNMYRSEPAIALDIGDTPSYRKGRHAPMSIREENLMEEVLGPDNTSAQQWDSWFAVFGPRNERGNPAALFDPLTGALDKAIVEQYNRYDIGHLLRTDPAKHAPLFRQRVRLIVGDQDNFYLNEAVALLKADLDAVAPPPAGDSVVGYIRILPGFDHSTIYGTPEMRGIPAEMVEHLRRAGLVH